MRIAPFRRRRPRRIAVTILLAAGGLSAPAHADQFQFHWCRGYASEAVADAERNFYSNCGGTGDRWGTNYSGHLNWCASIPDEDGTGEYMAVAGGERRARRQLLQQCRAASMAPPPFVDPRDPFKGEPTPAAPADGDCGPGWYVGSDGTCYPRLG